MATLSCSPFTIFAEGHFLRNALNLLQGTCFMSLLLQQNASLSGWPKGDRAHAKCVQAKQGPFFCQSSDWGRARWLLCNLKRDTYRNDWVLIVKAWHALSRACAVHVAESWLAYVCVTLQFNSVGDSDTELCEIYTINLMLTRANARLHCQLSVSRVYYDVNMYACHSCHWWIV